MMPRENMANEIIIADFLYRYLLHYHWDQYIFITEDFSSLESPQVNRQCLGHN